MSEAQEMSSDQNQKNNAVSQKHGENKNNADFEASKNSSSRRSFNDGNNYWTSTNRWNNNYNERFNNLKFYNQNKGHSKTNADLNPNDVGYYSNQTKKTYPNKRYINKNSNYNRSVPHQKRAQPYQSSHFNPFQTKSYYSDLHPRSQYSPTPPFEKLNLKDDRKDKELLPIQQVPSTNKNNTSPADKFKFQELLPIQQVPSTNKKNTSPADKSKLKGLLPIKKVTEVIKQAATSTSNSHPRISVRPLTDLVKSELLEICIPIQSEIVDNSKEPDAIELADRIVNKVAKMDKRYIKSVINNPDSKFNEALLLKSRQRLRDAIRIQLESMYQKHKKPIENNNFEIETDAIVDAVYLPEILYDQIRDAYGMDIFNDKKNINENIEHSIDNQSAAMTSIFNQNETETSTPEINQNSKTENVIPSLLSLNVSPPNSPDLMTRIRNLEMIKSKSDRTSCEKAPSAKNAVQTSPKRDDVSSSCQVKEVPTKEKTANSKRNTNVTSKPSERSNIRDTKIKRSLSSSSSPRKSHTSRNESDSKSTSRNSTSKTNETSKKVSNDDVMVINSSTDSSSSTSDSSSSDSDSSSTSDSSNANSAQLKATKKKSLEDSVLENFKHLIFSTLSVSLQKRFNNKKTKIQQLNFIADSCLPVIKKQKLLELDKIKNFKTNLNSECNENCLKTLLHSMLSMYEKEKKHNSNSKETAPSCEKNGNTQSKLPSKPNESDISSNETTLNNHNKTSDHPTEKSPCIISPGTDGVIPKQTQLLETDSNASSCTTKLSSKDAVDRISSKNQIIVQQPPAVIPLTQTLISSNDKSSSVNNQLANNKETAESAPRVTSNIIVDTAKDSNDCNIKSVSGKNESETSNRLNCNDDMEAISNEKSKCNRIIESQSNSTDSGSDCDMENGLEKTCDNFNEVPERSWKSPGEKKCIETAEQTTTCSITQSESLLNTRLCILNSFELANLQMMPWNNRPNQLSDSVLQAIREIDMKMMKNHQHKIEIDDMILKLQKDKMNADMQTIQLQNEKLLLINSAVANSSMSITTDQLLATRNMQMASTTIANESSPSRKRKAPSSSPKKAPFSTPFSSKLRNRKKRCQRDILIEDTANAIFNDDTERSKILLNSNADSISENADEMFRVTSRRSTKSANSKLAKSTKKNDSKTSAAVTKEVANTIATEPFHKSKSILPTVQNDANVIAEASTSNVSYANIEPGLFEKTKFPITHIKVVDDWVLAASEDGLVYKFNIRTKVTESKFSHHTEAITSLFVDSKNFVYTTSLDGYFKKTLIENFGLGLQTINVNEPLQTAEYQWEIVFLGSRWGNVYTYNVLTSKLNSLILCSLNKSIISLKATKEGARRILIISSKGNDIQFRDASCGILLRSLTVPEGLYVPSMTLSNNNLYCGTQQNLVMKFDFSSGDLLERLTSGNGAVSMKMHSNKDIYVACYDGFVYVYGTNGTKGRVAGSGKMILSLEIAGNKIITSSKDNAMELLDIPQFLLV